MSSGRSNVRVARPACKFLAGTGGRLGDLIEHGRVLQQLETLVQEHLPSQLTGHCRVANLAGSTLVLHVDSSIWATMLRYQCPRLLADLRARPGLERLRDIRVKIVPHAAPDAGGTPGARTLSPEAARLLRAVADNTDAPALSRALRRLAERAKTS